MILKLKLEELKGLNDSQLMNLREELANDISFMEDVLDDPNASTEQKSEFINSDIKDAKERLALVETVAKERGLITVRQR